VKFGFGSIYDFNQTIVDFIFFGRGLVLFWANFLGIFGKNREIPKKTVTFSVFGAPI